MFERSVERRLHCLVQHALVVLTCAVAGPDHMDHVVCRHGSCSRDRSVTRRDRAALANPRSRLTLHRAPSSSHDRRSDPAAVREMLIGGVDDRIDVLTGEIPGDHTNKRGTDAAHGNKATGMWQSYPRGMVRLLSAFLLSAAILGGSFGEATASVTPVSGGRMELTLTVEVAGEADAVVAHVVDIGGGEAIVGLAPRGAGEWGGTTETEVSNLVVVFEAIRAGGGSDMSEPVTLATLGVDPGFLGLEGSGTTLAPEEGYSKSTLRWGWGALALAALALALLAFWAAGSRSRDASQG